MVLILLIGLLSLSMGASSNSLMANSNSDTQTSTERDVQAEEETRNQVSSAQDSVEQQEEMIDSVTPVKLPSFIRSLHNYRLNAYWITKDFMELTVQEFEEAWKEVIAILTQSERQWFYFCDKQEDFVEGNSYWLKLLQQCQHYDAWLNQTYVDIATGQLLYKEEAVKIPERVTPLIKYWNLTAAVGYEGERPYTHFYGFFIDCLSYFFCSSVDNAYQVLSNTELYNLYLKAAKVCLERINRYLSKLKDTTLHASYELTVKKYLEILDLLEHERIKELLGGAND